MALATSNGQVMISYAWKPAQSQTVAMEIKKLLTDHGYEVWIDIDKMSGDIFDAMEEAVRTSDVIIVIFSKGYLDSVNCKKEFTYANSKDPDMIIPVKCMDWNYEGWLAFHLTGKLYYNLQLKGEAKEEEMMKLLKAVSEKMSVKRLKASGKAVAPVRPMQPSVGTGGNRPEKLIPDPQPASASTTCTWRPAKTLEDLSHFAIDPKGFEGWYICPERKGMFERKSLTVVLRSPLNGKWLASEPNQLVANRSTVGGWEKFRIDMRTREGENAIHETGKDSDSYFAIKTSHGFLTASNSNMSYTVASEDSVLPRACLFKILIQNGGEEHIVILNDSLDHDNVILTKCDGKFQFEWERKTLKSESSWFCSWQDRDVKLKQSLTAFDTPSRFNYFSLESQVESIRIKSPRFSKQVVLSTNTSFLSSSSSAVFNLFLTGFENEALVRVRNEQLEWFLCHFVESKSGKHVVECREKFDPFQMLQYFAPWGVDVTEPDVCFFFKIVKIKPMAIALKAGSHFLSVDQSGRVNATKDSVGEKETFHIVDALF